MKKTGIIGFFDQVIQETKKITWPNRKELTTSVIVVIIAVILFSFVILALDYGIHNLVQFLLNIGNN